MKRQIIVGSETDRQVVACLVGRIDKKHRFSVSILPDLPAIITSGESYRLRSDLTKDAALVVVYDKESGTVADGKYVGPILERTIFCPAIPQTDAWLFADREAVAEVAPPSTYATVMRLPSPEHIPYPRMIRHYLLRGNDALFAVVSKMDLHKAASRSASLCFFLQTIEGMIEEYSTYSFNNSSSNYFSREILMSLIGEVYPGNRNIFRTSSGFMVSADQMIAEIESGSEMGLSYATTLLRVVRDFLKRQAERDTGEARR